MTPAGSNKIVLLGMMSKIPVAGVIWQTVHYAVGLKQLGYDVHYVETHAGTPSMLMSSEDDDSGAMAAAFIGRVMGRCGLGDRWALNALHDQGQCFGMSKEALMRLYRSASLLINLHGGTMPLPELAATGRLVYLETDPVLLQMELHAGLQETIDFLEAHCAYFTFAENYGNADCGLPTQDRFPLRPTRQPVVLDLWEGHARGPGHAFTTVGNWRQPDRDIVFRGETYHWSKHHEFLKFIELPRRVSAPFELALSSYEEEDRLMLERHGWHVRHALDFTSEPDPYRDYIGGSRGEFTVAKDQNVRLRTGWFSDRSATYLAAGRPVVSQDTGFSNVIPTGEGLRGFSTLDEACDAIERVHGDYDRHRKAASELAREYFSHEVVLGRLLADVDAQRPNWRSTDSMRDADEAERSPFPLETVLTPISRRPVRLPESTVETVMSRPVPAAAAPSPQGPPNASVVVVTYENLVFTRLCLESLLAVTAPGYELVVVDNGSMDGTPAYLEELAASNPSVRVLLNDQNRGFAPASNQGLEAASGETLVLLNNDTMVAPGWLERLRARLEDPGIGLVGPVTNRIGNEAEIEAEYETWGGFLAFAAERARRHEDELFDIPTLTMFCLAMRRDLYERVGPLDERFEVGTLEDDDYSMRVRSAGLRLVCAEDVFVHHFGEASFGKLVPTGEYADVVGANRSRFEEKWGVPWEPYGRRTKPEYADMTERIREIAARVLPPRSTVLVVSRGDEELLKLNGCRARHFPEGEGGAYAGHHPADSGEAVEWLERMKASGGEYILFPKTGLWWLDHYKGLEEHLERTGTEVVREEETCVIFALGDKGA